MQHTRLSLRNTTRLVMHQRRHDNVITNRAETAPKRDHSFVFFHFPRLIHSGLRSGQTPFVAQDLAQNHQIENTNSTASNIISSRNKAKAANATRCMQCRRFTHTLVHMSNLCELVAVGFLHHN